MIDVREPAVAGMFYPGNPEKLKADVERYIENVHLDKKYEKIFGIIAPHAGYMYSGQTAAYAYKTIMNKSFDAVVVISPSHREYFNGISIFTGEAYKTPLGVVEVDKSLSINIVEKFDRVELSNRGHGMEHALEVHLPFLQTVLNDFKLVPVVMGDQSENNINTLSEVLKFVYNDKKLLVVASSDLSHFHSKEIANELDGQIEKHINNFDYMKLMEDLNYRTVEACGGGPIVSLMKAADELGFGKAEVLFRNDSGDITKDYREVVGYLSAVVYE